MMQGKFVHLISVQGDPEAQIVRGILESEGFEVLLVSDVPHSVYPLTVNGLGKVRIQVPSHDFEVARALLDNAREAGLEFLNGGDATAW